MSKKMNNNEKRIQEKYREEFKARFRERIAKNEVMDFTQKTLLANP